MDKPILSDTLVIESKLQHLVLNFKGFSWIELDEVSILEEFDGRGVLFDSLEEFFLSLAFHLSFIFVQNVYILRSDTRFSI